MFDLKAAKQNSGLQPLNTHQCVKNVLGVIFKAFLLERDISQHESKHQAEKRKKESYLALLGEMQQLID